MKKLFLFVSVAALMATGCSSDDDSNNNQNAFDSNIIVNGEEFTPDENDGTNSPIFTTFVTDGDNSTRSFQMSRMGSSPLDTEILAFQVTYPSTQESIDGTYNLDTENPSPYASGSYANSTAEPAFFFLNGGTVTITDLGNNRFKLEFGNVTGTSNPFGGETEVTVTGYFDGTFVLMEED